MIATLLVALGAGVGAAVRFLSSRRWDGELPVGTLAVNVAGSFALGALAGLGVSDGVGALLGVGFAGGLTTYSAFAVQAHVRGATRGTAYAVLTVSLSFLACVLGFVVGGVGG